MKRKPKFFIGFLAAAITFGTLMATIGPRHYIHPAHHCAEKGNIPLKSETPTQKTNHNF